MTLLRTHPVAAITAVLGLALLAPPRIPGKEEVFAAHDCAITVPEGWTLLTEMPPKPALVATYGNPDRTAILMLIVMEDNAPTEPLNERTAASFDRGMERSGGGKRTASRFIEIEGIKAYEREGTAVIQGREASTLAVAVPTNGKAYSVLALDFDGVASQDPEIHAAVRSLRFIKPPSGGISASARLSRSTSSSTITVYRTAHMMGTATVVGVGLAVTLVTLAILLIPLMRRRTNPQVVTPPPLPSRRRF